MHLLALPLPPGTPDHRPVDAPTHRLCFDSLFREGHGYAFPCDGGGRVDLDGLSERARANYLYARAVVGRELATPQVRRVRD